MNYSTEENLLDFSVADRMPRQLEHRFLQALSDRVAVELFPGKYQDYLDHFYQSGYSEIILRRAEQLTEELFLMYQKNTGDSADPAIYELIDREYDGLLDQFIILHCGELHGFDLPQPILRYTNKQAAAINLEQMIFDYLQFDKEPETVYTDFPRIPATAMQNALHSFFLPGKDERLFFICDQSVLGSCKEGFAMTDQGIYWKAHLHPAAQVLYQDLQGLRRDNGDWITINDHYFNVNPSVNIKLFKLLRKLQQWFA